VISVGNITLGGTGKTPLVLYIAQMLTKLGFAAAILTRGYGRKRSAETHTLAPGQTIPDPASVLGDEPAWIRRNHPACWMGVSKDRFRAGEILAPQAPRMVCILDDGFQHRALSRDLDIVVLDGSRSLRSDRVFPRGTLREPLSGLRRCDVIVVNGSADSPESACLIEEIRHLQARARIFFCRQCIGTLLPFPIWEKMNAGAAAGEGGSRDREQPAAVKARSALPAYLATGIGNPQRFQRDILQFGIDVRGTRFFPDHRRLNRRDWEACIGEARRIGAEMLVTTEKDAVKIVEPPDFPLLVAMQTTDMPDREAFELVLKNRIEERL
jgi:tetraacyldisaccharide 4'-kinase